MAANFHLDTLDKRILIHLMNDARTSYNFIAEKCKVSHTAVRQRVEKLKEAGFFSGSQLLLNTKQMGYHTCAFIGIQINLTSAHTHEQVFERIRQIPEIVECHHISGKYSLLAKLLTRNNEHLKQVIVEQIQVIPEVTFTETFISLEEGFSRQLPVI